MSEDDNNVVSIFKNKNQFKVDNEIDDLLNMLCGSSVSIFIAIKEGDEESEASSRKHSQEIRQQIYDLTGLDGDYGIED